MSEIIENRGPTTTGVSVPSFVQKVTLNSVQAQKVMRRSFSRTAGSLYRTDVILRIMGEKEEALAVEKVIRDLMGKVETEIMELHKELKQQLEEVGIVDSPVYSEPEEHSIDITSPQVGRFVSITVRLDKLVTLYDTLWLSGMLSNEDRLEVTYRWQQKVIGMGAQIIGLERRARNAAKRKGLGDKIDEEVPVTKEEGASKSAA